MSVATTTSGAIVEHRARVMGSELHLVVDGRDALAHGAERMLRHLERRWSRFLPDSDISRLNRSPGRAVPVDPSPLTLVDRMVAAWTTSAGRYDPTLLPELLRAGYVASLEDARARTAPPAVGQEAPPWALLDVEVDHDRSTVTLPPGISLDPGGIGKGLAADLVASWLVDRGASGALVDVGGDLRSIGRPPTAHGWVVRVEDPFVPGEVAMVLALDRGGVCTSSTRSRRWMHEGAEHHHLIDPRTRREAVTDLASATVLAPTAAEAEVRATSALLAGSALALAELDDDRLPAVLTTEDGRRLTTAVLGDVTGAAAHGAHEPTEETR